MKKRRGCCAAYWNSNLKQHLHHLLIDARHRWLVTGALLCGVLSACAPVTQRVRVDNAAIENEARKQQQVAVQAYLDDQKRLMQVSYPLLTQGADLCGEDIRYTTGMAIANSSTLLGEPFKETAERSYRLSDQAQVVYVVPGAAADKAGIRAGDTVLQIGPWLPTGNGPEVVKEALNQLQLQTQNGQAVRMDVLRQNSGKKFSILVVPDRACAYPVLLGNGDEVNAYADGKQVIVQRGMMRFANNDTELALVVSHEIAHNSMGHMRSKMTNYALGSILDIAAQLLLKIPTQGLFGNAGARAYSQGFESEADYVGLYIMARAGGNIDQAPQFWRRMATLSPAAIQSSHTSTHPATPERFVALEETVKEIKAKKAAGKPLEPNLKGGPSPSPDMPDDHAQSPSRSQASP